MLEPLPTMEQLVSLTEIMLWDMLHKSIHTVLRWRLGKKLRQDQLHKSLVECATSIINRYQHEQDRIHSDIPCEIVDVVVDHPESYVELRTHLKMIPTVKIYYRLMEMYPGQYYVSGVRYTTNDNENQGGELCSVNTVIVRMT